MWFFAPEGFAFPKALSSWTQDKDWIIPRALTTKLSLGDLRPDINYNKSITIKAPDKTGKFKLLYQLLCEGFVGRHEELQVKVE